MAKRDIAKIDVRLLPSAEVRKTNDVTFKDVYGSIFHSPTLYTTDLSQYNKSTYFTQTVNNQTGTSNANNSNDFSPNNRKFSITSSVSKPPADLIFDGPTCTLLGNAVISTPYALFDDIPTRLDKYDNIFTGEKELSSISEIPWFDNIEDKSYFAYSREGSSSLSLVSSKSNCWTPLTDNSPFNSQFKEDDRGGVFGYDLTGVGLRSSLISTFYLRKNQPFAIKFSFDNPLTQQELTKGQTSGGNIIPRFILSFGDNYYLSVNSDGGIKLEFKSTDADKKNTSTLVGSGNIPSFNSKGENTLTIYPLGNFIYVYTGIPSTESTQTNKYLKFDMRGPVDIPSSKLVVELNFCFIYFQFSPIVHPHNGVFKSPPIQDSSAKYLIGCVGKFGAGSRGQNISFPDKGDRGGFYTYLSDTRIEVSSGYTVTLKVKNSTSAEQAKATAKSNQSFNDKNAQDIKDGKKTAKETNPTTILIDAALENVYSPGIYYIQTIIPGVVESKSFSAEVDNADVISVTVNQAVEENRCTIVLDNKLEECRNNSDGKYIGGEFVGIKPIQVKMGVEGTADNTVFTGYIVNRSYTKQPGGASTSVWECEDMTKRAKESFAIMFPFFDGWCLGKDSRILTTNGLETIKDLSDRNEKFDIISGYEDHSGAVVKGCFAFKSGDKEVYKIVLNNGQEIKSTLDHKFLKFDKSKPQYCHNFYGSEWSKLMDLKVGDKIKVNDRLGRAFVYDTSEDCSIDELLGWMVGDGYYNLDLEDYDKRAMGMVFGKYDYQALRHLYPIWIKLLKSLTSGTAKSKPYADKSNTITIASSHKKLSEFLLSRGFKTAPARIKTLPDYIWTASVQRQCAFLRGLFSADGTVGGGHGKHNRVALATNSKQLALDVQNLLLSLGIASNIINKPYSNYKQVNKNPRLDGYDLIICGEASIKYMKHIRFLLDRKNNKWECPQVANKPHDFQEILSIEKVGIEDVYDISMPSIHAFYANGIYAHNCHLAAFYYLARQAGYADNEITLDGTTPIKGLLNGDPDSFTGGCFDGHIDGQGVGGGDKSISSDYLHMRLPMAMLGGFEEPNFAFQMGTPIWSCMQRLRQFNNWYLFANSEGKLVYGPPKKIIKDSSKSFVLTDTAGDFNEIQRHIDTHFDTSELRNIVSLFGTTFLRDSVKDKSGSWILHRHEYASANNVTDPSFAPWLRRAFMRDPKWEDPGLARLAAKEILRRVTRNRYVASFSAWGQPDIKPYNVITIDEKETGANTTSLVVASHTLTADAQTHQLSSEFTCEAFDPGTVNYDPNLPTGRRE